MGAEEAARNARYEAGAVESKCVFLRRFVSTTPHRFVSRIKSQEEQLDELKSVRRLKYEALRTIGQARGGGYQGGSRAAAGQGEQAYRGASWLQNNRDQFKVGQLPVVYKQRP